MASRRAVLGLLRTAPIRPSRVLAAPAWSSAPRCAPAVARRVLVPLATRPYSQSPAQSQSKIWNFEDIQKLTRNPDAKVVIVDTREPSELENTGRIPGAINVPITSAPDSFHLSEDEFEDRFGFARPARDAEVVFYCKAGVRSRAAAGIAREAGWTKVGEYPGSWLDWEGKGGQVQR